MALPTTPETSAAVGNQLLAALAGHAASPTPQEPTAEKWFAPAQDTNYFDFTEGKEIVRVVNSEGLRAMAEHFAPLMRSAQAVNKQVGIALDTETTATRALLDKHERATAWLQGFEAELAALSKDDPNYTAAREKRNEARARYKNLTDEVQKAGLRVHSGEVRLVQIYHEPDPMVWVVDRWCLSPAEWQFLCAFLARPELVWICHNAYFDAAMMACHGSTPHLPPHCTQLQAIALSPTKRTRKTLAARCAEVLGLTPSKELQASDWGRMELSDEQLRYAAGDVVATARLFAGQHQLLKQRATNPRLTRAGGNFTDENPLTTYDLLRGTIPAVSEVRVTGMPFNRKAHVALIEGDGTPENPGMEAEAAALQAECIETFARFAADKGMPAVENPGSPQQIGLWIADAVAKSPGGVFTNGGWPRTATGTYSTDKDVIAANLSMLLPEYQHPLKLLLQWKKVQKSADTLGHAFAKHINQTTGRIHANFRIGTETLRFSVTDPPLQTINREGKFRTLFEAMPGYRVVIADYGQIEVRVAAVLSYDKALLKAIEEGADIHTMVAMASFRGSWEDAFKAWMMATYPNLYTHDDLIRVMDWLALSKDKSVTKFFKEGPLSWMRQGSKITVFANQYGAQPPTIYQQWMAQGVKGATLDDARTVQQNIFDMFPDYAGWMTDVREECMGPPRDVRVMGDNGTGLLWTPMGNVYEPDNPKQLFTKAVNTPVQGGAAEITLRALRCFPRAWRPKNEPHIQAALCHLVHDELVALAREDDAERAKEAVVKAMTWAATSTFPTIPRTKLVEATIGTSWGAK